MPSLNLRFIYLFIYFVVLGIEPRVILPLSYTPSPICVYVGVGGCGTGDGTQGHSTSELHLSPILFFYFETGSH